ncbi:glycine cleavage system protein R [Paraferrimonas haliotis]|uniref:Glycine cleavage system transcriptional repressor n=1 Tax=Paraferrimonas haliotis TaxID=2013866 RepID=A0AA37TTN3_9GAMM|nr:ACT domain-containing protein [Paraferrimonas haliotis]GLS84282.1 glycine cleavage system protein R [Paraferrimonas haliotis]
MTEFLVVTAVGADRPGIVNRFTRLASDCDCNIVDSRMALYGKELTLSLMLSGDWGAITRIESALPALGVELEFHTVIKRTTEHTAQDFTAKMEISLKGPDRLGTMSELTQFFAEQELELSGLRSLALKNGQQELHFSLNLPPQADSNKLSQQLEELATSLSLTCQITLLDVSEQ